MISFTSKKLGDIAFITKLAGFEHTKYIQGKCSHTKLDDSYIPLFIGKTIHEGKIDNNFDWYISKSISDQLPRSKLNKKCLIVPYVGSLGDIAIFPATYEAHLGSNVGKIELNPDSGYSESFLYYYLKSPIGQQYLLKEEQGGVQKNITMEAIRNVLLPDLDLSTQKKIADVLSCIDDKIALNNKTNTELENMAKTIYDYWFTQFDFPDKNGHPYKTSGSQMVYNETLKREIPAGWEVGKLRNYLDCNKNSVTKNHKLDYINYLDTGSLTENIITEFQIIKNTDSLPSRAKRIVKKNDILYSSVRPLLKHYGIIKTPKENMIASTGFIILSSKKDSKYNDFFYNFIILESNLNKLVSIAASNVSAYPSITPDDLLDLYIPMPKDFNLLDDFISKIQPIYELINKNQKESEELTKFRDYLLPLLMNGQIEVK